MLWRFKHIQVHLFRLHLARPAGWRVQAEAAGLRGKLQSVQKVDVPASSWKQACLRGCARLAALSIRTADARAGSLLGDKLCGKRRRAPGPPDSPPA